MLCRVQKYLGLEIHEVYGSTISINNVLSVHSCTAQLTISLVLGGFVYYVLKQIFFNIS